MNDVNQHLTSNDNLYSVATEKFDNNGNQEYSELEKNALQTVSVYSKKEKVESSLKYDKNGIQEYLDNNDLQTVSVTLEDIKLDECGKQCEVNARMPKKEASISTETELSIDPNQKLEPECFNFQAVNIETQISEVNQKLEYLFKSTKRLRKGDVSGPDERAYYRDRDGFNLPDAASKDRDIQKNHEQIRLICKSTLHYQQGSKYDYLYTLFIEWIQKNDLTRFQFLSKLNEYEFDVSHICEDSKKFDKRNKLF